MSQIYKSKSQDIWFNLALEQKLLKKAEKEPLLYLWRNDRTVVIGKYQNAYSECRLEEMEKAGVKLARRKSGGGAVYQDLGNLCFTIAGKRKNFEKLDKLEIVIEALNKAGLPAKHSGRNDIILEGRKISGSAFQFTNNFVSYHGTMLFDVDLTAMSKYLTPSKKKLIAKGVKSVAARVVNIKELRPDFTMARFEKALISEFVSTFGDCKEVIEINENEQLEELKFFADPTFIYSKLDNFPIKVDIKIPDCEMQFNFRVEKGKIKAVKIFSDTLEQDSIEELEKVLFNCAWDKTSLDGLTLKKIQPSLALAAVINKLSFN